jgi:hypothetical protein
MAWWKNNNVAAQIENYALNPVKATSADKGAVRNRALLDGIVDAVK